MISNSLTLQELIKEYYKKINECVELTNKSHDIIKYINDFGLTENIKKEIQLLIDNKTFENMIDVKLQPTLELIDNKILELTQLKENIILKDNIINNLVSGGIENVLSAEQGKELKNLFDTSKAELVQNINRLDSDLKEDITTLELLINENINSTKTELTENINLTKTELTENINLTKTELTENINLTKTELNNKINTLYEEKDVTLLNGWNSLVPFNFKKPIARKNLSNNSVTIDFIINDGLKTLNNPICKVPFPSINKKSFIVGCGTNDGVFTGFATCSIEVDTGNIYFSTLPPNNTQLIYVNYTYFL